MELFYDTALTFGWLRTTGEPRLVCCATIAIQTQTHEYVLSSIEIETFTSGPQVDQVRNRLLDFVENEGTQYRMLAACRRDKNKCIG